MRNQNYRPLDLEREDLRTQAQRDQEERAAVSISDLHGMLQIFGAGAESHSGEVVNQTTALTVPAIWQAVNFISDSIAALPLHVFKRTDEGQVKADADPIYRLLKDQVNSEYLTSFQFRKQMVTSVLLYGRAYAYIERNRAGRVMNLIPFEDASAMTVESVSVEGSDFPKRVYRYKGTAYEAWKILDFAKMLKPNGRDHYNPVEMNRDAIGLALAAERFASQVFAGGGIPALALHLPAMGSSASAERAGKDINNALVRVRDEKRNILVMPNGAELRPIGFDPDKTQLLALRQFQVLEAARIFNLPPAFLHDLSTGTYSNTEQQSINLVKLTLMPLIEMMEQEFNAKLFSDKNRVNFVKFNVDALQRGDFTSRMEGLNTAVNAGILTVDEARALEDRPAHPNGWGAVPRAQGGLMPLADIDKASTTPTPTGPTNTGDADTEEETPQ